MSRAFVNEDNLQQGVTLTAQELNTALEGEIFGTSYGAPKNFITPNGFENLQTQLVHLKHIEKPALVKKTLQKFKLMK